MLRSQAVSRTGGRLVCILATLTALAACGGVRSFGVDPQGIASGLAFRPRVALDARPNGIAVRPSDGTVFITDDRTNSVLSSANGMTFAPYVSIPVVPGQPNSLSQLAFARSDVLFAVRFGFGTASAVYRIAGPGMQTALSGPDPARRRLGLVALGDGELLSSWFIKQGENPPQGGLSLLTYDAATQTTVERDLIKGLGKPVGVVVSNGTVFVSDQASNRIVKANLNQLLSEPEAASSYITVAQVDRPDLLAVDAGGTLYTKCNKNALCTIAPDGTVGVLADDVQDARGVAVDDARHKLYVVDRAGSAESTSYLRIFWLK